jgi:ferredoxin
MKETYSIAIDPQRCIGCTICREQLGSLIQFDGYHAYIDPKRAHEIEENDILYRKALKAQEDCPAGALIAAYRSPNERTA